MGTKTYHKHPAKDYKSYEAKKAEGVPQPKHKSVVLLSLTNTSDSEVKGIGFSGRNFILTLAIVCTVLVNILM